MSLDWNTRECVNNGVTSGWIPLPEEEVKPDGRECYIHSDTNSLVWGAFCGFHIGRITPQNIDEVIWRIWFLNKIDRPWMSDGEFPSILAVHQHLGLHTNCDTKTRKQWLAFITRSLSDDVSKEIEDSYTKEEYAHAVNMSALATTVD